MHHPEISQFVGIFQESTTAVNDPYPVKVEAILVPGKTAASALRHAGIRLITIAGNSRITIEVDNSQQDSNETKILYYSNLADDSPSLFLRNLDSPLNFCEIKNIVEVLNQVAKGKMCLLTLRAVGAIGSFRVQQE